MADIQKVSVALTGEQVATLKAAVDSGEYATTSEIIREAIRDWQFKRELREDDAKRLRRLWDEARRAARRSRSILRAQLPAQRRGARKLARGDARRHITRRRARP